MPGRRLLPVGIAIPDFVNVFRNEVLMAIRVPRCPDCAHSPIRLSRIRWQEVFRLAMLQRPFRCMACGRRFMGKFFSFDLMRLIHRICC